MQHGSYQVLGVDHQPLLDSGEVLLYRGIEHAEVRDGTWITDAIAKENGLDLAQGTFANELWRTTHQSFTLARYVAENKFGPHFVSCKTPLGNIRITTFFAGEHEVRIIDPDQVEFVECVGCRLQELSAGDL